MPRASGSRAANAVGRDSLRASKIRTERPQMEAGRIKGSDRESSDDLLQRLFWKVKEIHSALGEVQKFWAKRLDITVSQWNILMGIASLEDGEGARVNLVSAKLGVDGSFITAQSQLLETKGLICRKPSADDRRVVLLALSSKARREVDELSGSRNAVNAYVSHNVSGKAGRLVAELGELKTVLKRAELMTASEML